MSIREDVELYTKLSGEDGSHETIATIGAYLRGYRQGKEDAEPHWIPVEQELPEKSGEYLVTVKWVTGESDVDVYEYDARHKTWNDGESAGGERAVAWCNLPEPYKGVTT